MQARILYLLVACLCSLSSLPAKIIETRYFTTLLPLIDQETWLLVDLDNTLFEGKQALGHANQFYDELQKRLDKGMAKNEAIRDFYPEWILSQKRNAVKPLEEASIGALMGLQHQGITVMGLTHRQPMIASSTLAQVESLGVDFLRTAPSKDIFSIPAEHPTLYIQGILFVGDFNKKSAVFFPFLDKIESYPKKIIFIDDKRKNVEEMEEACLQAGIDYVGIHYTAIDYAEPIYSPDIAAFQRRLLDKVLSNEAAKLLMENGLE